MIKDFYIFRHGETECNREGRIQGCGIDLPLNDTGRLQAQALAERLVPLGIERIYASNLKRALQTAQICADRLKVGVEVIPELREGCFGAAEGLLKDEAASRYADIYREWYSPNDDMSIRFPGGESKQEMQNRMFAVIEGLLDTPYQTVGIASHGGSIRYLLYKFGLTPHKMPNTALFHLRCDNAEWRLIEA